MTQLDSTTVLNQMLRRALRPLVRICLRQSVKVLDVVEILKVVFVEVAKEELARAGDATSASRLSVMTGVHRKDTTRILKDRGVVKAAPNLISRVIGQWRHDRRFCEKSGEPRLLTVEGLDSEFAALVRSVSGDLAPYTVLFEMERLQMVERTPTGIRLRSQLFVLRQGDTIQGMQMLGEDLEDLGAAVSQNLNDEEKTRNLHLKTEYTRINPKHLPEVKQWLLERGTRFHKEAETFLSQFDADCNPAQVQGDVRVAVGSFSIVDTTVENREDA